MVLLDDNLNEWYTHGQKEEFRWLVCFLLIFLYLLRLSLILKSFYLLHGFSTKLCINTYEYMHTCKCMYVYICIYFTVISTIIFWCMVTKDVFGSASTVRTCLVNLELHSKILCFFRQCLLGSHRARSWFSLVRWRLKISASGFPAVSVSAVTEKWDLDVKKLDSGLQ